MLLSVFEVQFRSSKINLMKQDPLTVLCSVLNLKYLFSCHQVNSLPADKLQEIQKAIELFSVGQGPAKTMEEATRRSYQFWDTQPVPKLGRKFQSLVQLVLHASPTHGLCSMSITVFQPCRGNCDVTRLH